MALGGRSKRNGKKYTDAITKETKETQASGCQLETLIALKHLVLNEFLELIESSIQNSNPSRRLLTVSGQYAPVYERFVPVYGAGIFFSIMFGYPNHFMESALKDTRNFGGLGVQLSL